MHLADRENTILMPIGIPNRQPKKKFNIWKLNNAFTLFPWVESMNPLIFFSRLVFVDIAMHRCFMMILKLANEFEANHFSFATQVIHWLHFHATDRIRQLQIYKRVFIGNQHFLFLLSFFLYTHKYTHFIQTHHKNNNKKREENSFSCQRLYVRSFVRSTLHLFVWALWVTDT